MGVIGNHTSALRTSTISVRYRTKTCPMDNESMEKSMMEDMSYIETTHQTNQYTAIKYNYKEACDVKMTSGTGADPGGARRARAPPSSAKKKKRGERERKEKKKKRGKRKRDIKLRCHNLFFCAYIDLHWPMGGQGAPTPINEGEI